MNNPLIKLLKSKIYTAIFLLAILLCAGVVGFKILSQLSWIDAFLHDGYYHYHSRFW